MTITAAAGPSAYWYLTRGTGTIALILLTLTVALGVANVRRLKTEAMPRFVMDAVHRNVSLLAMAFLLIHILTSVLDRFAPIQLLDAVIPFRSSYRPLWLGLGAVAFDLLLAVTITSLLRRHFGYRSWRAIHWAAYASWPFALVHGLGTGTDTKTTWTLAIVACCVIVVIVAVVARATAGWPEHVGARMAAIGASVLVPLGLLVWLPSGPLAAGWAQRAGTPPSLLAASSGSSPTSSQSSSTSAGGHAASAARSSAATSFTAQASGTVQQAQSNDGLTVVNLSLNLSGQQLSTLQVRITGQAVDGGGVEMTSSRVTLGASSDPHQYRGTVTALEGSTIRAAVRNASGGSISLLAQLQLDPSGGTATGTVTASPGQG